MIIYTVPDNAFAVAGIKQGDILTFEESEPKTGDFTLLTYKGEYQLVWLIGYDFIKHPIICSKYDGFPDALSFPCKVTLTGRVTNIKRESTRPA